MRMHYCLSENYVQTFHPVALKVLPPLPTVIVLSHIPGSVAGEIIIIGQEVCHIMRL